MCCTAGSGLRARCGEGLLKLKQRAVPRFSPHWRFGLPTPGVWGWGQRNSSRTLLERDPWKEAGSYPNKTLLAFGGVHTPKTLIGRSEALPWSPNFSVAHSKIYIPSKISRVRYKWTFIQHPAVRLCSIAVGLAATGVFVCNAGWKRPALG